MSEPCQMKADPARSKAPVQIDREPGTRYFNDACEGSVELPFVGPKRVVRIAGIDSLTEASDCASVVDLHMGPRPRAKRPTSFDKSMLLHYAR